MTTGREKLARIAKSLGIEDVLEGPVSGVIGARAHAGEGASVTTEDPSTGARLGIVRGASKAEHDAVIAQAQARFESWRMVPAPVRGQLVRRLGELLRALKEPLGELVSLEMGKIKSEGLGEVQEMIDICEFAVGLSRQLHGLTIASERTRHRMMEQWHPLGPVAVITAFNFPVAVWAWNAALAAVCGDTVVWKPSPHAPLCALAVQRICERAMSDVGQPGVFSLLVGGHEAGQWMAEDRRLPLVSFTGSSAVGAKVGSAVASRLGKSLLELGGNNAIVVLADADLDLATRAIVFGAVGTAGQRCTSTRRVLVAAEVKDALLERLVRAYGTVKIGDPLEEGVLMGPLITEAAVARYEHALAEATKAGARILCGGKRVARPGHFVEPTIVLAAGDQAGLPIAYEETFAPILYVIGIDSLEQGIDANNAVAQGLSSAIFTDSVRASEQFLSPMGSDCGIANVNIGTSGAEIGGAFGGEKDTGGGRESGSDAWKAYMRRQTSTVNWGRDLPLAQGVRFG
ncbi:MAG: aldehyde dehydrogenase family protein [Sandaracinaceae bacterium]|nr:aldehyde dehydrogenase family protein [Sandaracinaceae bacterium]